MMQGRAVPMEALKTVKDKLSCHEWDSNLQSKAYIAACAQYVMYTCIVHVVLYARGLEGGGRVACETNVTVSVSDWCVHCSVNVYTNRMLYG